MNHMPSKQEDSFHTMSMRRKFVKGPAPSETHNLHNNGVVRFPKPKGYARLKPVDSKTRQLHEEKYRENA